jgi:hypothetical protein
LLFQPNSVWLRYTVWARVTLTSLALGLSYFYPLNAPSLFYILSAFYLAYTVLVALRVKGLTGTTGLLALFGDTIFFLVIACSAGEQLLWMVALLFLYLLTEALIL